MKHREIRVRLKKPSKSTLLLFALLLIAAALLYSRLNSQRNDLAALQGDLQAAREELQQTQEELQQAREAADSASAGLADLQDRVAAMRKEQDAAQHRGLSGPEILAETPVIAHGMGAVNLEGQYYNSLEAFQASYAAGIRVFEVDLRLTRDGKAVLTHGWADTYAIPTLEEFLSTPVQGPNGEQHTPLSFRKLLNLMAQYPDICVITDSKYTDPEMIALEFSSMLADAEDLELTGLFDRMIIQLYNRDMRQCLDALYPFPHFIYTLYPEGQPNSDSFRDLAAYCAETGVMGITMLNSWWNDSFAAAAKEYGVKVYVHTENDLDAARSFLERGVSGVYTDRLTPDNFL